MLLPILIGTALAATALAVARRPNTFHVERSVTIAVPPERTFAHVNDFRAWANWSPYEGLDPNLKKTFSGPTSGTGAGYGWSGNNKAGEGQMVITRSQVPSLITIRLEFTKPFKAVNEGRFSFQPVPEGTRVTWSMNGENNFAAKAFQLVVNMDELVGKDFARGLANLKVLAENNASAA